MYGDKEWQRVQAERLEREARHEADLTARGDALEALLALAEHDRDAARLVAVAKLIRPDDFATRESFRQVVERERTGPGSNDPGRQRAAAAHERVGRVSIEYAIRLARQVLALVESWD